jgi:hypothetical protein
VFAVKALLKCGASVIPLTSHGDRYGQYDPLLERHDSPETVIYLETLLNQVVANELPQHAQCNGLDFRFCVEPGLEDDAISSTKSVLIGAGEQLLPKPYKCSKRENCAQWKRQQRKLQGLQEEFCVNADLEDPEPSVVASSDVLGLGNFPQFEITSEKLPEVASQDPVEKVQQFLSFQQILLRF